MAGEPRTHLFPQNTGRPRNYTYPKKVVSAEFKLPPRDDRVLHGERLQDELNGATTEKSSMEPASSRAKGTTVEFQSSEGFELAFESLDLQRSRIELRNLREEDGVQIATVFIPEGKESIFLKQFQAYAGDLDPKTKKPKKKKLVESINRIKLAQIRSFWTDAVEFPDHESTESFELWIRRVSGDSDESDLEQLTRNASNAGVIIDRKSIVFPERIVILARGSVARLLQIEGLYDFLAEIRLARIPNCEFLNLPSRDQGDILRDFLQSVSAPRADASKVCHLDTGIRADHPLLTIAVDQNDVLFVAPYKTGTDTDGHGTGMAGLALYGCLNEAFNLAMPIQLQHRVESVKMFMPESIDPDLNGHVTSQAVSQIEITAGDANRTFCLTITAADGRDEGFPSSWSAKLDSLCAGDESEDAPRRLICISAGNLDLEERHEYPARNEVEGIKDPAQSWNALSVGAMTDKVIISDSEFPDWKPIADRGLLSPASRTSTVWGDKSWPIKPDIVMEGGNNAIDPSTGKADRVEDLSLLTTRQSPDGALLSTTGDTSAATALASRYAAHIWTEYAHLWPESVRGLLVHSARWNDAMLKQFSDKKKHARLRTYGYGVPNLDRALKSVNNAATMVVQQSVQPFDWDSEAKRVKSKHMHLHELPWPIEVLRSISDQDVKMRITLSYFIEPNPGRRGWKKKHRYQSHGLRFDVKIPSETLSEFEARISKDAQADDDDLAPQKDDRAWELGNYYRRKGSIHSDVWTGTAEDLANSGFIAVFPVTGWWKERKSLNGWKKKAKYSLIVSLETASQDVDLYTEIEQKISIKSAIATEIQTSK